MGIAFAIVPGHMIPSIATSPDALTTTRVLGVTLLAVCILTFRLVVDSCRWPSPDTPPFSLRESTTTIEALFVANLVFHIGAGCLLGWSFYQSNGDCPFGPPTMLHIILTIVCGFGLQKLPKTTKQAVGKPKTR